MKTRYLLLRIGGVLLALLAMYFLSFGPLFVYGGKQVSSAILGDGGNLASAEKRLLQIESFYWPILTLSANSVGFGWIVSRYLIACELVMYPRTSRYQYNDLFR